MQNWTIWSTWTGVEAVGWRWTLAVLGSLKVDVAYLMLVGIVNLAVRVADQLWKDSEVLSASATVELAGRLALELPERVEAMLLLRLSELPSDDSVAVE